LEYVCAFLGSGIGRAGSQHPLGISVAAGATLLVGYFAALGRLAFRCRDREYCRAVAPWIALGGYSVASACLAALGRIEWGVSQSLESRYVAFSLYLTVAMIALTVIFAAEISQKQPTAATHLIVVTLIAFCAGTFLVFETLCAIASLPMFRVRSSVARLGYGAVLFSAIVDTSKAIQVANFPRPAFVRNNADALDRLRLLRTPLLRTRAISKLRHTEAIEGMAAGWFDGLRMDRPQTRTAWGWAVLTGRGRSADGVVLAYADERGEWIAFAFSDGILNRPDVTRLMGTSEYDGAGWRAEFPISAAPPAAQISAWAVDAKEAKLYRLKAERPMLNQ
jgi:hypothetical protein